MGVLRHHRHRYYCLLLATFTLVFFLFSCSASATLITSSQPSVVGAVKEGHEMEEVEKEKGSLVREEKIRFGGPGSSPPSCRSKCGWCSPCQAVHVPVQPGLIIRLEYYPEAWRCKCGNKLYMP